MKIGLSRAERGMWDELAIDLMDLRVLSDRVDSLRDRYSRCDATCDMDVFWSAFDEVSSFLDQRVFDLAYDVRNLRDFHLDGIPIEP